MSAQILFRTNDIQVTPVLARFGPASYQVAAISSVAVYHRPKLNPMAVTLAAAAIALGAFAFLAREQQPDYSLWSAVAAGAALILAVGWQRFRPVLEYHFVMRAAGGETENVTTFDREQVFELREAIESAFHVQHARGEPVQTARVESPTTAGISPGLGPEPAAEVRPDDDFRITPDWRVAGAGIASR